MFRLLYQALLWPAYQVLLWLSLPGVLIRLEWLARREPEYGQRVDERLGRIPNEIAPGCIWFHAVSAGETIAVAPLIADLASEFPENNAAPLLVTTTTPTGSAEVGSRLGHLVHHCYVPYDYRFAVRSFFDRVQPRLLVLVETELWPNLIDEAYRRGIPVLLVNARLSERSARGYGIVRSLTRRMLGKVDFVACQYDDHLERFNALGLGSERGAAFGSIKWDATLPDDHADRVAALRRELGFCRGQPDSPPCAVWIAGSTHPGEDELVLKAHAQVHGHHPDSCLLLVPRHPVRGEEVAKLALHRGFTVRRLGSKVRVHAKAPVRDGSASEDSTSHRAEDSTHSPTSETPAHSLEPLSSETRADSLDPSPPETPADPLEPLPSETPADSSAPLPPIHPADPHNPPQVIVCDTMGQLQTLYGLSQVAFLGGSLVPVGGHNPIEAALCRQPLAMGPHTFNFEEVVAAFAEARCLTRVQTAAELADAVIAAFDDDTARAAAGARALGVVEENRGAGARLLELLRTRIRAAIA